jgi:hypothetical protein
MPRILSGFSIVVALLTSAGGALADCPPSFVIKDGRCEIKRDCPPGMIMREGHCAPSSTCPWGTRNLDGFCVANPPSGASGGK